MVDTTSELIEAKYHLAVAKRMYANYARFQDKRTLVGMIRELARSTGKLIRAFLILEGKRRLKDFRKIAKKYLDNEVHEHLMKVLEVERAQKKSPVQFDRGGKIILLINGEYKIITIQRLGEFLQSLEKGVLSFQHERRQV